jgi:hypothetical protein
MAVAGKADSGKSRRRPPMVPSTRSTDLGYHSDITGPQRPRSSA